MANKNNLSNEEVRVLGVLLATRGIRESEIRKLSPELVDKFRAPLQQLMSSLIHWYGLEKAHVNSTVQGGEYKQLLNQVQQEAGKAFPALQEALLALPFISKTSSNGKSIDHLADNNWLSAPYPQIVESIGGGIAR